MGEQKIMRCPFRKDDSGDFALCYGAECMAYYECDMPAIPSYTQQAIVPPPTRIKLCRQMPLNVPYGCCGV